MDQPYQPGCEITQTLLCSVVNAVTSRPQIPGPSHINFPLPASSFRTMLRTLPLGSPLKTSIVRFNGLIIHQMVRVKSPCSSIRLVRRFRDLTILQALTSAFGRWHYGSDRRAASYPTNVSFLFLTTDLEIFPFHPPSRTTTISPLLPQPAPFCFPFSLVLPEFWVTHVLL